MNVIKKLFFVKSPGEAVFVIAILLAVVTMININYLQHHQRYHRFILDSSVSDEVFIEKMKSGTIILEKSRDKRSSRPVIHYKIILNNGDILESSMVLGEFELLPNEVIFEEVNGSIGYVDQYRHDTGIPPFPNSTVQ